MTDTKTLQDIAEKTIAFDRAHFVDDTEPTAESLITNHERLPSDPKMITRLRPRYAVALGFFEGYAKAVEVERSNKPHMSEDASSIFRSYEGIAEKAANHVRTYDCMVSQFDLKKFVLVALNEGCRYRSGATISHASMLALAYANGVADTQSEWVDKIIALEESERSVCVAAKQLEEEIATLVKQRDDRTREWMAAQTALDKEQTLHARTKAELATVKDRTMSSLQSLTKLVAYWRDVMQSNTIGDGFRDALKSCAKELEKAIVESQNIGIVKRPPPPPPPVAPLAPNELITEVGDDLAQAAADYANAIGNDPPSLKDKKFAMAAVDGVDGFLPEWDGAVRSFVNGARWQLARIAKSHVDRKVKEWTTKESAQLLEDLSSPIGNVQADEDPSGFFFLENGVPKFKSAKTGNVIAFKTSDEQREQFASVEPMSEEQGKAWLKTIVFRDNDERSFWESMTLVLARKGDTTSQSVASAADELVEERRARMPIGTEKEVKPQSTEPSDELLSKAARFANKECRYSEMKDDLENALRSLLIADASEVRAKWSIAIRAYVAGALGK